MGRPRKEPTSHIRIKDSALAKIEAEALARGVKNVEMLDVALGVWFAMADEARTEAMRTPRPN